MSREQLTDLDIVLVETEKLEKLSKVTVHHMDTMLNKYYFENNIGQLDVQIKDKEVSKMKSIQIFVGAEGIVEAYRRTLQSKAIDAVCLSSNYSAVIGDFYDKEYVAKLRGKGVRTREILPDTAGNREDAKSKDGVKSQVRFVKAGVSSESDLMFYDDKAVMVSYDVKNPWAMEIGDTNMVSNLRNQFEELWGRL